MELLVSFVSGGLVSGLMLFVARTSVDARRMRLSQIEDLALCAAAYRISLETYYLNWERVLFGRMTENQLNDLLVEDRDTSKSELYRRFFVLLKIHFPELKEFADRILEARSQANAVTIEFSRQSDSGTNLDLSFGPRLQDRAERLSRVFDDLDDVLIAESERARKVLFLTLR